MNVSPSAAKPEGHAGEWHKVTPDGIFVNHDPEALRDAPLTDGPPLTLSWDKQVGHYYMIGMFAIFSDSATTSIPLEQPGCFTVPMR